jgi:hypothetical protein
MNTPPLVAPAEDERASAGIRRTKARVGLAGFCVAGLGAYAHGDVLFSAGVRALAGGVTGYLVGWLVAVTVWRRIMRAETRHAIDILRDRQVKRAPTTAALAEETAKNQQAA